MGKPEGSPKPDISMIMYVVNIFRKWIDTDDCDLSIIIMPHGREEKDSFYNFDILS